MRIWKQKSKRRTREGGAFKIVIMLLLIVLLSAFFIMLMVASSDKTPSDAERWEEAYGSVPSARTQKMVDYINAPMMEDEPNYDLNITITHKWE